MPYSERDLRKFAHLLARPGEASIQVLGSPEGTIRLRITEDEGATYWHEELSYELWKEVLSLASKI